MTELTTEAGRSLRNLWSLDGGTERRLSAAIGAVEAEARAGERERIASDVGGWDSMFEAVLTRAIDKARGIANEEFVQAIAQRDEARAERDTYARAINRLERVFHVVRGECVEPGCPLPDSIAWHDERDPTNDVLPRRLNHPILSAPNYGRDAAKCPDCSHTVMEHASRPNAGGCRHETLTGNNCPCWRWISDEVEACDHEWFEDMNVGSVAPMRRCRLCRVVTAA